MNFKKGIFRIFLANVLNLVVSLFTGFVLPKMLSMETYADIKLFQLYITYLGILHLGYSDGMYLHYGGKKASEIKKEDVAAEFSTFRVFQMALSVIGIVVFAIMQNWILMLCALVILPINAANYIRNLYQATGEFEKYSRFTNIGTLIMFIINLFLLFIVKTDNSMIFLMLYVVAYFIYWIFIEIENRKLFGKTFGKPRKKYLIEDVKDGFFLMTGNFCGVIFTSIDRLFVQNLLGQIKFALYSFAVSIEGMLGVFITPISTVLYNFFCNNRDVSKVLKIKRLTLAMASVIMTGVFPAKFIVNAWIDKYNGAIFVLVVLFAAQFTSMIVRCVHINLYKSEKRQNKYFAIMVCIVILSAVLDLVAYLVWGNIEFIAIATLVTNLIWFIVGEIDLRRYRMKMREYVGFLMILALLLVSGLAIENAFFGALVYIVGCLLVFVLAMPKVLSDSKNMINDLVKKK